MCTHMVSMYLMSLSEYLCCISNHVKCLHITSQVLDESPCAVLAPRVAVRPQRGGRAHVEIPPLLTPSSVGDGVEVEPCSLLVIPHDGVDGRLDIVPDVPEMAGSGY